MTVTHPRIHRVLLRGVGFCEEERAFVVRVGPFRGRIDVEDTPFWVTAYDAETGRIWLTDGGREPIAAETLSVDEDGVLRCRVKGRFPARFTRTGQAHLLDALEPDAAPWVLRLGSERIPVPGLAPLPAEAAPGSPQG